MVGKLSRRELETQCEELTVGLFQPPGQLLVGESE
jgi:hypothetical protein